MILETQPKTFVIAIKGHPISEKQLQDCLDSADKFDWNVEVFWGVDGRTITSKTWEEEGLVPRLDKPTMSRPGVQGCFLSHYSLWKTCIELDKPIIILEHDAIIQRPWVPMEINQDLVKLHRHYAGKKPKIDNDSGSWSKSGHAYCLSPTHADALINFVKKVGAFEADRLIGSNVISFTHLGSPSLVERQNSYSTTNQLGVL
jgi:hypothetical protein